MRSEATRSGAGPRALAVALLGSATACSAGAGAAPATSTTAAAPGEGRPACQDFFRHVNRDWLARAVIPADAARWGVRDAMRDQTRSVLHQILESIRTTTARGTTEAVVATFYRTCLAAERDDGGVAVLRGELARIDAVGSRAALTRAVARLHRQGVPVLFSLAAAQDATQATRVIADVTPVGALGLPDRDDYLGNDATTRTAYRDLVARMLELSGLPAGAARSGAGRVLALETSLARASLTIAERQDPAALDHPMDLARLAALTPRWPWPAYLRAMGQPDLTVVNIQEPRYLAAVDDLMDSVPLDDWKIYLRWRLAAALAAHLGPAFAAEDFRFAALLGGAPSPPARWKVCVGVTDETLGEALGRLYVEREFPPRARADMLALVRNVVAAFRDDLATLPWMGAETRRQARAKLDAFAIKIGHPEVWRDDSALAVSDGPFAANLIRAREHETIRQLAKIGRPVDRDEWLQTPPTVDAYFDYRLNKASFPAGLLQPPYFDPDGDPAANYGAIATVIGHELTHGFDDTGRRFDAAGNLRDWWTPADAAAYAARAARLVDQYQAYSVGGGLHIDGRQTLSENIADLGGVRLAYAAMERALRDEPRTGGPSPARRFFLAYARSWAGLFRPEALRAFVRTNTHSPFPWRVNGPLANMPEFARAFGCRPGDPMVRPAAVRARIW